MTKRDREGAKDVGDVRMARRMRRAGTSVTWNDVDATTSTDGPSAIELPPWLLRDRVFQYLVAPPIMYVTDGVADPKRYERALGPLRAVCQQWQKLVQFLLKEAQLRVKVIDIRTAMPALLTRKVSKDGHVVEDLSLVMAWPYFPNSREFNALDIKRMKSWWCQYFQSYSNVLRLDLTVVAMGCLESVIPAAATCCHLLQALLIPSSRQTETSGGIRAAVTVSIVQALEKWYQHNGGLLMTTAPWWIQEFAACYRDFMEAVASFCPCLQYLYEDQDTKPPVFCRAALPIEVWFRFCLSCTQLHKLSWTTGDISLEEVKAAIVSTQPCLVQASMVFTWNREGTTSYLSLIRGLVEVIWNRLAVAIDTHCPDLEVQWSEIVKATTETGATPDERWARLRHWRQIAWRQLCSSVVAHLWFKRVAETHEPTADPPEADWPTVLVRWREALFGTTAHLSSARSDTRDLDLALHRRLCRRLLQDDLQEVSVPISRDARYLLFFDGGSRGNPGPGGSGAVIVTIQPGSHVARLVWVAAMSYASKSTTNNLAEYRGLRTGLQAAADHKWHPLHVIGDSQLILNQMRRRTLPKTASLRHEFLKAQQLCDGLVIAGWHHHYRTYNKMADKAANVAMDECASMQVYAESSRPLISSVQLLMQQDVYQWASAQWGDT